jgi:hypothetical protein
LTSLNSFTASQDTKNSTLASVTSSLNNATASLFTSASLALVTASVNLNTITFTKGDTTTFAITVNTGSGGGTLPSGLLSSSVTNFVDYSASVDSRINGIVAGTGFATTGSNSFNGNQIITGSITSTLNSSFNGVSVGIGSGSSTTNLAIGSGSLSSNSGTSNIGIGTGTLAVNKSTSNIAIGTSALASQLFTGNGLNIAIGGSTLSLLGSGSAALAAQLQANTIIGSNTGTSMVVGARNTIMGASAFQSADNVQRLTGIGRGVFSGIGSFALNNGSGSQYNTAIGHNALFSLQSGSNNIVMHGGSVAGEGFITGSRNTVLGMDSGLPSSMESNTIIGRGITGLTSPLANAVVLADGSGNVLFNRPSLNANTQINSSLDISGSVTITGSLTLSSSAAIELQIIGNSVFTGSAFGNVVSMSIASSTASLNLNAGNYFTLSIPTGTTRISPSNIQAGTSATLVITTASGSLVTFDSSVKQPSGSAYVPTSGSTDILSFVSVNSSSLFVVATKNMI